MKPEQLIYQRLKSFLQSNLPKGRYLLLRIETSTAPGVPDIYFCYQNGSMWLETKTLNYKISNEQIAWAHIHALAGGITKIVTLLDNSLVILDFNDDMAHYSTLQAYLRAKQPPLTPVQAYFSNSNLQP